MVHRLIGRWLAGLLLMACVANPLVAEDTETQLPAEPPLPSIKSLKLEPAKLVLEHGRDARQVLVLGITEDGLQVDLTDKAKATNRLVIAWQALGSFDATTEDGTVVVEQPSCREEAVDLIGRRRESLFCSEMAAAITQYQETDREDRLG